MDAEIVALKNPGDPRTGALHDVDVFFCDRGMCAQPMLGFPQVSIRGGDDRWRHYHLECRPTMGNG